MSLTIFIPSKDRPQQLRLLLKSIKDNLPLEEINEILIYHTSSTPEFAAGYNKLFAEQIVKATWMKESSSKASIESLYFNTSTYYLILTDDSLVYSYVPTLKNALNLLDTHTNVLTFTLRLGFNTTVVDYTKPNREEYDIDSLLVEHQCLDKSKKHHAEGVYTWNWKSTRIPHFSHPISLDGTIIRKTDLSMLTRDAEHGSYRQWECCISNYVKRFDKNLHGCFERSSVVTIPINQVVNADRLTDGVYFPLTPKELNDNYLSGYVVDYHRLLKDTEYSVNTPQKEFLLQYRRSRWYDRFIGR